MSESTMELRMPPTTAMASGFSMAEPAPMPKAKGSMPATVAKAVMAMGRRRRRPAWIMASSEEKPRSRKRCSASKRRFPFLGVEAAIFDTDGRRQTQIGHGFLYRDDAAAKVHAFEAPSDLYKALQIFAADFRLAGIHAESR